MLQESQTEPPHNNKLKYFQSLLIALIFSGFEAISFVSTSVGLNSGTVSIVYRFGFVVICLLVLINSGLKKRVLFNTPLLFVLIFWTIYLLRGVYDSFLNTVAIQSMISLYWYFAFFLCFIPIIACSASINNRTFIYSKKILLVLALFVNVVSIMRNIMDVTLSAQTRYNANEVINSITYGQSGLVLLIISLSYLLSVKNKLKYVYLIFMLLGLTNIAVAASRGPVLQFVVVLGFYLFSNVKRISLKRLIIPASVALFFITYIVEFVNFDNVIGRIVNSNIEEERTGIFMSSWQGFLENPILGSRAIGEYSHNIFLGSLEALGIVGGALILVIYFYAFKQAYRLSKNRSTDWIGLLLVMYLVSALSSGAIWKYVVLWPLLALAFNIGQRRYIGEKLNHL